MCMSVSFIFMHYLYENQYSISNQMFKMPFLFPVHGFRRVHRPGQDVQRRQRLLRLFGRGDAAVQRPYRQPPQERAAPLQQQQRHLRI